MSSDGGYGKSTRESQTLLGAAGNKSISLVGNVAVVKTRKYSLASGVFIAFFMVMGGETWPPPFLAGRARGIAR